MPEPSCSEQGSYPVGEGPEYDAIRAEARKLLPLFSGPGISLTRGDWGAGIIETLRPVDGGHQASIIYPVVSRWEKWRNSLRRPVTVEEIRATGIALLAYAEAHDDAA